MTSGRKLLMQSQRFSRFLYYIKILQVFFEKLRRFTPKMKKCGNHYSRFILLMWLSRPQTLIPNFQLWMMNISSLFHRSQSITFREMTRKETSSGNEIMQRFHVLQLPLRRFRERDSTSLMRAPGRWSSCNMTPNICN